MGEVSFFILWSEISLQVKVVNSESNINLGLIFLVINKLGWSKNPKKNSPKDISCSLISIKVRFCSHEPHLYWYMHGVMGNSGSKPTIWIKKCIWPIEASRISTRHHILGMIQILMLVNFIYFLLIFFITIRISIFKFWQKLKL